MTNEKDGDGPNSVRDAIRMADDFTDPLDGLVERVSKDLGAAFTPDVIAELAALKADDRAAFEAQRAALKQAGCRVTALDEAIAKESGDSGRPPTQADTLINLAGAAELFHSACGTAYADIEIDGHRETWPVRSKGFRRWLAWQFYKETREAPGTQALQSALTVIEARAEFDGLEVPVYVRVGGHDDRIYLDLCDRAWRAVEITSKGWRVIDRPPVRFRRAAGMQPLPSPIPGGTIESLRPLLNFQSNDDFILVIAWMLAVLRNRGPYPVIVLTGEQGSAKSTFCAILRAQLDPNAAPLRALPRDNRDLFIAANNGHVLAFDNVSSLAPGISDTFCRLASGGGFAVRQLYTDQDEVLFDAARPIILNGIEGIVARPDLADRAIFLTLEAIPENRRRPEAELWAVVDEKRPAILGALLDAVVVGLRRLPDTHLPRLPRMADFALWATACEPAFGTAGSFGSAYCSNQDRAVDDVIDADPVAAAVRSLMADKPDWTGTATELFSVLTKAEGERVAKSRAWPANARALSGCLSRAATFLRSIGIEIKHKREGRARTRVIYIRAERDSPDPNCDGARPSAPSAPSAQSRAPSNSNGKSMLDGTPSQNSVVAAMDGAEGQQGRGGSALSPNHRKTTSSVSADATDAKTPPSSGALSSGRNCSSLRKHPSP